MISYVQEACNPRMASNHDSAPSHTSGLGQLQVYGLVPTDSSF